MGCLFVKDWDCSVEGEEFPLEICRVCLQARSAAFEGKKVISRTAAREALPSTARPEERKELAVGGKKAGLGEPLTAEKREEALRELNRRFIKGEIPAPDYVNERAALTLGRRE